MIITLSVFAEPFASDHVRRRNTRVDAERDVRVGEVLLVREVSTSSAADQNWFAFFILPAIVAGVQRCARPRLGTLSPREQERPTNEDRPFLLDGADHRVLDLEGAAQFRRAHLEHSRVVASPFGDG